MFIVNQPRFDVHGILDAVADHKVTTICAPPTVWRMLVQEDLRNWHEHCANCVGAASRSTPR